MPARDAPGISALVVKIVSLEALPVPMLSGAIAAGTWRREAVPDQHFRGIPMNGWLKIALALPGLLVGLSLRPAAAQTISTRPQSFQVNPITRPTVSPYLNLFRGGNPAVNYYDLVRPQQQFANSLQQLQQQAAPVVPLTAETVQGIPVTGHTAVFMNFSRFYNRPIGGPATLNPVTVPPATLPPVTLPTAGFGTLRR